MLRQGSLAVLLSVISCMAHGQTSGTITGEVVDQNGSPVAHAMVEAAQKNDVRPGHRLSNAVETDQNGDFTISGIHWGTYVVMGWKPDSGYPDTRLAFYSDLHVPNVTLDAGHPTRSITVTLGPKSGWLDLTVVDSVTGKPIRAATVTLTRVNGPHYFVMLSASERHIDVPSDVDISVAVTASGYSLWPEQSQPYIVHIAADATQELTVSLNPK